MMGNEMRAITLASPGRVCDFRSIGHCAENRLVGLNQGLGFTLRVADTEVFYVLLSPTLLPSSPTHFTSPKRGPWDSLWQVYTAGVVRLVFSSLKVAQFFPDVSPFFFSQHAFGS